MAIVVAAVAAWLAGAVWYGALFAKPWMAANGLTAATRRNAALPFIISFLAELVMAWVLAGMVGHLGAVTVRSAVISALFAWAGFVLTTTLVNNAFSGRRYTLTAVDAGHWLFALLLMGVVIGWIGV